jgi:hypothetical protein
MPKRLFLDNRVEAASVAEFLDRYYRPERYKGQGEEYAAVLLASHEKDFRENGYDIISHHDSVTGKVVAIFADLHVWTNGPDKVVAIDEAQARELLTEYATEDFDDDMDVRQEEDSKTIIINFEDELDDFPEGYEFIEGSKVRIQATCQAWANWNGIGFLSTINY